MTDYFHRIAQKLAESGPDAFSSAERLEKGLTAWFVPRSLRAQLREAIPWVLRGEVNLNSLGADIEAFAWWRRIREIYNRELQLRDRVESASPFMKFLLKVNYLRIFDPIWWPYRETVSRICASIVISVFVGRMIYFFDQYPGKFSVFKQWYLDNGLTLEAAKALWGLRLSLWSIETGIFVGYLVAYLIRAKAKGVARGFHEVVFPFLIAGIPVVMAMFRVNAPDIAGEVAQKLGTVPQWTQFWILVTIFGIMVFGGAVNLIGLITMRKAFTIMAEARTLVKHGIFRLVRHPLYAGHFVMFFGSLCLRLYWYTVVMYAVFLVGQYIRARLEEKKLQRVFPDYAEYRAETGMFFPKLF
ncbi:MAG: hypothetical protein Kow00107_06420 [Planctomycetota bacterium]